MDPRPSGSRSKASSSPFRREPLAETPVYEIDERVSHDRHGLGRVVRVHNGRMYVKFGEQTVDVDCRSPRIHHI